MPLTSSDGAGFMRRVLPWIAILTLAGCATKRAEEPHQPQQPQSQPGPAPAATTLPPQGYPPAQAAPSGNVLKSQTESGEVVVFEDVDSAERELTRAHLELRGMVSDKKRNTADKTAEAERLSRGDSACGNACKAFASMKRAADAVCRLTKEADARCVRARTLVKENETRVAACGCEPPKE
jgi:hypothetical protein